MVWGAVALGALATAAALATALTRWTQKSSTGMPVLTAPNLRSMGPAPDFTLRSFSGPPIVLSTYRGKPVVLNYWASWCVPCREEMPNLERAWREFRDRGVVVLGVNVTDDYDDAQMLLRNLTITYPNVFDPEQTRLNSYGVAGLPTTFFVDPQMRLRDEVPGGFVGSDGYQRLRRQIMALLRL
jgi:cytochrome c biogenesis protein CcmG/thiol:disulfide interchange protein DsbE